MRRKYLVLSLLLIKPVISETYINNVQVVQSELLAVNFSPPVFDQFLQIYHMSILNDRFDILFC